MTYQLTINVGFCLFITILMMMVDFWQTSLHFHMRWLPTTFHQNSIAKLWISSQCLGVSKIVLSCVILKLKPVKNFLIRCYSSIKFTLKRYKSFQVMCNSTSHPNDKLLESRQQGAVKVHKWIQQGSHIAKNWL